MRSETISLQRERERESDDGNGIFIVRTGATPRISISRWEDSARVECVYLMETHVPHSGVDRVPILIGSQPFRIVERHRLGPLEAL